MLNTLKLDSEPGCKNYIKKNSSMYFLQKYIQFLPVQIYLFSPTARPHAL